MKLLKLLKSSAASIALTGVLSFAPAMAADLGPYSPRSSSKDAPYTAPFNWAGFYAGVHAGYGWSDSTNRLQGVSGTTNFFGGSVASSVPVDAEGFIGGGQIGYNYLVGGGFLIGIEADFSVADLSETNSRISPNGDNRLVTAHQELNWFGTVRARLGMTPTNNLLVYATGGFAFGDGEVSTALTRLSGCAGNNCQKGSASETLTGWTVGGGLEYALAKNWTVKAEYLYVDLGSISHLMTDPNFPATVFRAEVPFQEHIARVGINYKF